MLKPGTAVSTISVSGYDDKKQMSSERARTVEDWNEDANALMDIVSGILPKWAVQAICAMAESTRVGDGEYIIEVTNETLAEFADWTVEFEQDDARQVVRVRTRPPLFKKES